ncbi:MAG: methyltransferase, partial [Mesorhizobium sp.]
MDAASDHSVDAFHRGRFVLVQPRRGHRTGMDAMVLAAALPSTFEGRLADLGAGAGGAGLAVLSRCPQASAWLIERDADMAEFARMTLARPENAAFATRAEIICADVELTGAARTQAGLAPNSVDAVIMNPPFNAPDDRQTDDPLR